VPADFWDREDVHNAVAAARDLSQGVVSTLMRGKRTVHSFHVLQRIADGLQLRSPRRASGSYGSDSPGVQALVQPLH
jgi:hypothetical protein